jgi:internalin A
MMVGAKSGTFIRRSNAMISLRQVSFLGLITVFAMSATAVQGQEKQAAGKGIDAATVAAYEKLGAKYGGWVVNTNSKAFYPGQQHAEKGMPGFFLRPFPNTKLPDVSVAFCLHLGGPEVTDAGLKELASLKNLTMLSLRFTKVTDAGLKELAPLHNLTSLDLEGTKITDAGLKELAPLKNLATIHLLNTKVTEEGLKELVPLKNLTTLEFTRATDTQLRVLREAGLLHVLILATSKDGARPKSAEEVISLRLNYGKVTDAGLKELAPLKNLTSLDLEQTAVTDAGLKELATRQNLTALNLGGTRVTDAGLKELAPLNNLTTLSLRGTRVTDAGLKELAPLKNITTLGLTSVTDTTLGSLREMGLLHALLGARGLGDSRPKSSEDVISMNLNYEKVTDAGLKELAGFKNMISLGLYDTKVTDIGLKELAPLTKLTTLYLGKTKVTDAGIAELQKALPNCQISR